MEEIRQKIENKTILVTGGTGSFGNAVTEKLLQYNPKKIIIFSRDEKKQFDMGNKFNSDKLKFLIGDVRDRDSVFHAMYGVDYVFHAAALKQVPNCEFFPTEAIKTNSLGAHNVIDAAIMNNVERVVVLSTDKAVHPINAMGMSKALMERIMIASSREGRGKTVLCGTRYGNVMYTRGSVIPFFIELMNSGKPLKITDKSMTRFLMPLSASVDLVLYALTNGENGDIYVKKSPASTVGDLARALIEIFNYDKGVEEIGIRPGEKMHESLISNEEVIRVDDKGDYFLIKPEPDMDYRKYYFEWIKDGHVLLENGYTSANTKQLNVEETKELLLSLDEIKQELKNWNNGK
ncbi:polysaccharide biosynthesis protein [Candidatus Wolfebacteria bacterium]|nr:polysaccharide biosynthesis protein [Candidatus Wolfebacteria bacterium]